VRIAAGSSGDLLLPSPPAEKITARQDQARKASTGNGAGTATGVNVTGPPLKYTGKFDGLGEVGALPGIMPQGDPRPWSARHGCPVGRHLWLKALTASPASKRDCTIRLWHYRNDWLHPRGDQLEHAGVYKCADEKAVSVYLAWLVYRLQIRYGSAPSLPLVDAKLWRRRSVSIAARLLEGSTVQAVSA
jgi:hypothetical protein